MLEGWHRVPGTVKNHCWSSVLLFHLSSPARDGFTNIYAQGTEETQKVKTKEGVELLMGGVRLVFVFPLNL